MHLIYLKLRQDPFPPKQSSCAFEFFAISFQILNYFGGKDLESTIDEDSQSNLFFTVQQGFNVIAVIKNGTSKKMKKNRVTWA